MKKLFTILAACLCVSSMWGTVTTFSYESYRGQGKSGGASDGTSVVSHTQDGITIAEANGYGGTQSSTYCQFYANGITTVTPSEGTTITSVVITATSNADNRSGGTWEASAGEVNKDDVTITWSGSASSAFTLSHTSQLRWTSIVVTYTSGGTQYNINIDDEIAHGKISANEVTAGENTIVTLTATPDFGYELSSWSVTNASTSATITVTDNKFTMPAAAVNVSATFAELPKHTAHFSVDGVIDDNDDTEVYEGKAITFPTDPEEIDGKKFQGWTKIQNYSNATTAPADLCKAANMGNADVTYYAVFADVVAGGEELQKITATNQVVAGTYAIISFDAQYYLPNAAATNAAPAATAVTAIDGKITVVDAMKWKLTISNNKYVFESATEEGKYLWGANTNDGIRVNTTSAKGSPFKEWVLVENATYGLILKDAGSTGRYLSTFSTQDWRNYTSVSNSNRAANLYKVVTGTINTNYATNVTFDNITISAAGYATYFNANHAVLVPANVEAYVWNNGLEKAYDAEAIIPAGTPVVLKANKGTYCLEYTTGGTAPTTNDLKGAANNMTAAEMATANPGMGKFYALSLNAAGETSSVGFYWVEDEGAAFDITAGKAYLALPGTTAPARFIFGQQDVPTEVVNVNDNNQSTKVLRDGRLYIVRDGNLFDLNGRLVK